MQLLAYQIIQSRVEANRNKIFVFILDHLSRLILSDTSEIQNPVISFLDSLEGRPPPVYAFSLPLYSISPIASITGRSICLFACPSLLTDWQLRSWCICQNIQHLAEIPETDNILRTRWLKEMRNYILWISCPAPLSLSFKFFFLFLIVLSFIHGFKNTRCINWRVWFGILEFVLSFCFPSEIHKSS